MRLQTLSLLALLLTAFLTGCDKKEDKLPDPTDNPNPVVPGHIGRYMHENNLGGYLEFFQNDTAHYGNANNGQYAEGTYQMLSKRQVKINVGNLGTGHFTTGFDTLFTQSNGNVWIKQ